jgi:hypothetical protein
MTSYEMVHDDLACSTFQHDACIKPASSHALRLSLISLPYCNHLVRLSAIDKCLRFLVAHPHLSNLTQLLQST